jgi:hypothetical protein
MKLTQFRVQGVPRSPSLRVKRPGPRVDCSPHQVPALKMRTIPYVPLWRVQGQLLSIFMSTI